jgi:hypothetical protein
VTGGTVRTRFARRGRDNMAIARRQILIQLDDARLRIALARLAEQDALIDVRQDDSRGELSVSLYGEVRAAIGAVLTALSRLGGAVGTPSLQGRLAIVETVLPAVRAHELHRQLPGRTGGEGALDSSFAGYRPDSGEQPTRRR